MVILSGSVKGAEPNSSWLANAGVALDSRGFVLTGTGAGRRTLETSRAGIFAVGDGAQVVANVHEYLATGAVLKPDGPVPMPAAHADRKAHP